MSGNLEQLDPNYVVAFDYSKDNVAKLVSEFQNHGLQTVTRPGHNSKTVYAFTRVDEPGVFESGEGFAEKHPSQQPSKSEKPSSSSTTGADTGVSNYDQQHAKSTTSGVDNSAGSLEKKGFAGQDRPDLSSASDGNTDISGDKKKKQGFLSEAQDTVKGQGGVQGLKDKAGKVPGADKAEGSLKKNVPGSDKLGGLGGAGGIAGAASGLSGGGSGSGAGKKGAADQAKGGLKGFNKDDLVKGGKDVLNGHKDELTEAGKKASKGDTSGLEGAGKNIGQDVAGRVDKDQLVSSGKKVFSGDKKDMLKNGKKALAKNQAENKGKEFLSGAGGAGGAGGLAGKAGLGGSNGDSSNTKEPLSKGAKSSTGGGDSTASRDAGGFVDNATAAPSGSKKGIKTDTELQGSEDDVPAGTESSMRSDAAVKGFPRDSSASPTPHDEKSAPSYTGVDTGSKNSSTSASTNEPPVPSTSVSGGRATLFAIVANFDFVQSVTPIYDVEKRKKLDATVNNLVQASTLVPTDHDLTNLEHLTRNPREILYFFYFKNYIRWLLPISLVGVVCRFFSRSVAPWEFNITYTSILIVWSLLFTSSWIYYFEPLHAKKLGKVLDVVTPSDKKLSAPHEVLYKKFVFLPVALLFAASLVAVQFLCFFIEIFVTQLYSGPFSGILALLPTALISAVVPVLTLIYNKLFVDPLVKWENGPNPKKSKTEKNYILTFLTSYVPLFITLFVYLPLGHKFTPDLQGGVASYAKKYHIPVIASDFIVDINRYKKQFFYYTVTAQIINMVLDNVVPLVLDVLVPSLAKDGNRSQSDVVAKIDSVVQSRYPQDFDLWKKVQLFHSSNYGEFDVDQNYSKLVVQFGYIAMFSIIWPLAPLIFTIIDLIIFRADLWRAFTKSKPSGNPTDLQVAKGGAHKVHVSSSPWNGILEKTTHLSFIVSVTLLLMYRYSNLPGVGLSTSLEKRDNWFKESPLVYSWPKILLAAAAAEHLALLGYLYVKDICLSYQTKFEPATLPYVKVQAKPVYSEKVDETAAIMEEVAYEPVEQPKPKNEESQQQTGTDRGASLDTSDNTFGAQSTGAGVHGDGGYSYDYDGGYAPSGERSAVGGVADDSHTKTSGYNDGYRAGYAKGFEGDHESDAFANKGSAASGFNDRYGKDTSSSGSQRRGYGKSGENNYFNDDVTAGAVGGLGVSGAAAAAASSANGVARKTGSSTRDSGSDVARSRSTKRASSHGGSSAAEKGRPSDKSSKESGRHTTSTKESNSSAQGNGKNFSAPHVVADSGSREIPAQSQGKNDLTSASKSASSKNSKAFGVAGGAAGAAGGAGLADTDRASSAKQHSNRESSYLESPTPSEDAGATLPDTIPTSKNYNSRYDKNDKPVKSAAQSEASPSASGNGDGGDIAGGAVGGGAAGGLDGLAAGAAGDLKSGKVTKESGDVGKDLKKDVGSDLKSGKLPKGADVGKDLKKDLPEDLPKDLP
ncbi:calcium-activated chloride channel-domain-containing protein, partial [Zygosaccharomyces rouxii]